MTESAFLTPFGLKGGNLVHIDDVPRGLKCECVCPACGGALIAQKGRIKAHHFAHAKGEDCAAGYETALHLVAKDLLLERREVALPAVEVSFSSYRKPIEIAPERVDSLESVQLERRVGEIIPDVLATVGGRKLLIEIRVTHTVDDLKLAKIRRLNLSTVEIDLSNSRSGLSLDELASHVIEPSPRKAWLYNTVAQHRHDNLVSSAKYLRKIRRGAAIHVDGCPLPARVWQGKAYVNIIDDCMDCRYAMTIGENISSVTCAVFNPATRELIDSFDAEKPQGQGGNTLHHST